MPPPEILARARESGVVGAVMIGTGVGDWKKVEGSWPWTAGFHPHELQNGPQDYAALEEQLSQGAWAVGEMGLDYHYDGDPLSQKNCALAQLEIAKRMGLPVIWHSRKAHCDTLSLIREFKGIRHMIHCFSDGPREAEAYLSEGAYLSFSGLLTFKNAQLVREAASLCPMNRIMVETDSPYLAPVPMRGKRNEPAYVPYVYTFMAKLKGVTQSHLAQCVRENLEAFFDRPLPKK